RAALALEPGFYMARYRLAHVLAAMGRTDDALAALDGIPDSAPTTKRERFYIDGARALIARDYESAKREYLALLEEFPYEVEARQFLAEVYDLEWNDEAALGQILILAGQEPENPTVWIDLGETYLRLGQLDEADQAMQRYLALLPLDPHGYTVLGELLRVEGSYAAASEHLVHALEINPGFHPARLALAQIFVLDGNEGEAERLLREVVDDATAIPAEKIDAGLALSSVLRAQGRFGESASLLERLEPDLRVEEIREAKALAIRGLDRLELGEPGRAEELIDLSIERTPTVPTRYLFAKGLLQLAREDLGGVRETAARIRTHAPPPEEQDFTEAKAAAYLDGMASLLSGDAEKAIRTLREVIQPDGYVYPYAVYELGLARALSAAGRQSEAARLAATAATERDAVDPRLDLELDRVRALLVEAEILAAAGDLEGAAEQATAFLDRFTGAPQDHPDVVRARQLGGRVSSRR
ncbi:MAG: tetratricopeptide repeat protein, partial [Acidobacteriota bacterium]|nr:tetratricopeptide repeat protein [Acidobacteriota bacterium]